MKRRPAVTMFIYRARVAGVWLMMATLAIPAHSHAADSGDVELKPVAFAQLTAEHTQSEGGINFGADRVRGGATLAWQQLTAGLVLDFNVDNLDDSPPGTLTNIIKDAYVGWRFNDIWRIKAGQFKSPVGMDFNTSGTGLDITKRGMEKGLVLERQLGVMLSADNLVDGLGVDVGIFNPAGRSSATAHTSAQEGEDNAAAVRVRFDRDQWHGQASYGISEAAGGSGGSATSDYKVLDLGGRYRMDKLTLKAELIRGEGLFGLSRNEETVWYAHAGYRLNDQWEAVVRHYQGEAKRTSGDTDLTNTYAGANFWPVQHPEVEVRLQFNYVLAGGDESRYTGTRGFRSDAVLVQLQLKLK